MPFAREEVLTASGDSLRQIAYVIELCLLYV